MAGRFGRIKAAQYPIGELLFNYKSMGCQIPEWHRIRWRGDDEVAGNEAKQGLGGCVSWAEKFRPTFLRFHFLSDGAGIGIAAFCLLQYAIADVRRGVVACV